MVELADLVFIFAVLRKRCGDYHRRADPGQGVEPSRRFAMKPNAAMRVRVGMDEAFVESRIVYTLLNGELEVVSYAGGD